MAEAGAFWTSLGEPERSTTAGPCGAPNTVTDEAAEAWSNTRRATSWCSQRPEVAGIAGAGRRAASPQEASCRFTE